jgi:hypothetical protein
VISLSDKRGSQSRHAFWNVTCSCGAKLVRSSNTLVQGRTRSCGCLQKEETRAKHLLPPYMSLYRVLVRTAKQRDHMLELSYDDFVAYTKISRCHYCFALINWCKENRAHNKGGYAYNLDRKDSRKGYTDENCVVCCGRCNRGKSNLFSYEEWRAMTEIFRRSE